MSRYIDAEWLKQNFNTVFWSQVAKTIDSAPSIEIIRCGECKWYNCGACFRDDGANNGRNADDFCSYGERSE